MATIQTSRGAETYIKVVADTANGAIASSVINLPGGMTVRQDATGGYTVRTSDLQALSAAGLIQSGPSTQAAFEAGRVS